MVWRSGTTRAKNGRGESPIVVVGRIDVVGVVEVETAVGMARRLMRDMLDAGMDRKSARERLLEF